jgi:Tfp pilus assembly protein PilZ
MSRSQLLLPLRNRAAFAEASFDQAASDRSGMFVPGDIDAPLGEEVELELRFQEERVTFFLVATVLWKRPSSTRRAVPPGTGLGFLPSDAHALSRVLAFVDGAPVSQKERDARRLPIVVDVKIDGTPGTHKTEDLSSGGCFVLMPHILPLRSRVKVKVRSEHALFGWLSVDGTVAWQRIDGDQTGVGVRFDIDSDRQRAKLDRLLQRLKERVRRLHVTQPPSSSVRRI